MTSPRRRSGRRPTAIARRPPLLDRALSAIRAVEPAAQVILFGSRARGDATAESDWDLLVLLDGPVDRDRAEAIRGQIYALELDSAQCISTIVHSHEEWDSPRLFVTPFHANVEDDGIDLATMRPAPRSDPARFTEEEMAEARGELEREWMERARTALNVAYLTAEDGLWNECVGRLYYACFHAACALLLQSGHRYSNHRGVQVLLNEHFIHTGLIPTDLGDRYNDLLKQRGRADYEAFVRFDEATVRPWIPDTERFIEHIAALLGRWALRHEVLGQLDLV